jgi:rhodanese-related sulfurtransferase
VLVDVRSANQFKDGHINGARNVPGDQIAAGAAALEKLKDKTLIMCCDSGTTSGAAARKLMQQGFNQVFNLRGGLAAWRQDNLPVVKG